MAYEWDASLETGDARIDSQHKTLIQAINNLLDACSSGRGKDELESTTRFLYEYTVRHFSDEEKLQRESDYPDMAAHRTYHDGFKAVVLDLCNQLKQQGATTILVAKVNTAIAGWLINHIKNEDVKVAAHIRSTVTV